MKSNFSPHMEGAIHPIIQGERKEKQVWGREVEMGKKLRKNLEEKRMRGCLGVWGLSGFSGV